MAKPKPFDIEELKVLIEESRALQMDGDSPDAFTAAEWAKHLGYSRKATLQWLHQMKGEGRLEVVNVRRELISGVMRPLPAYRVKL